jgi:TonB family protein
MPWRPMLGKKMPLAAFVSLFPAYKASMRMLQMLQIKPRLLLGALLLIGLGSCQREKPVRAEPAEPIAPAPAPALLDSLPETPATGQRVIRSWHHVARPTRAAAPLVYRRGTLRPAAAPDTSAGPPTEAQLHDLTLKASEYFQIDPTKPAEVHGREGTIVSIPAQALVNARQQPATGPVWVELKECYSIADMLLSNLSTTTASGDLLDSGGIVLVRASARGQQLHVAAGRAFQLQIPFSRRQRGMNLFYGRGGRQPTHWVAAGPAVVAPATARPVAGSANQMPSYGSGPADINQLVRYPQAAQANHVEGLVYASFVVDEAGQVVDPTIIRSLGYGCDEEVLRVLRQTSGHWTPAQQDGRLVKVKMVLPIRFSFRPGQMSAETGADAVPTAATPAAPATDDDNPDVEEAFETTADHYAFQVQQLGWLNCERAWQPSGAPVALLATADVEPGTSVHLVFRESTTILTGQPQDDGYHFSGVPANQRAVLVGVQYRNGTPYLALQEIVTGQRAAEALAFRETTLTELEQALEKLR